MTCSKSWKSSENPRYTRQLVPKLECCNVFTKLNNCENIILDRNVKQKYPLSIN